MKQLLIFFVFLACAFWIDLTPLSIHKAENDDIQVTVRSPDGSERTIVTGMYSTVGDVLENLDTDEETDTSVINPLTVLKDGDLISLPAKKEETEQQRISINTADEALLCTLPGIGKSTAKRIIAWREENGLFQEISDIMRVSGIGEKKYEKLKDLICL